MIAAHNTRCQSEAGLFRSIEPSEYSPETEIREDPIAVPVDDANRLWKSASAALDIDGGFGIVFASPR
jgi:hypothetical protein